MRGPLLVAALAVAVPALVAQQVADRDPAAERVRAHMTFLASDHLEGREAGSRGYDIAADYVASQFRQLGLTPAGDNGTYFQRVPLVAFRLAGEGSFVLTEGERRVPLSFGEDYFPLRVARDGAVTTTAPLVFAWYGLVAPERGRDDYDGVDVRGKVVVVLAGAPLSYPTEERAYYANARTKRTEAERRGAVGLITVNTPADEKRRPFSDALRTWDSWGMTWATPAGAPFDPAPKAPLLATVSAAGAAKLFEGAPMTFAQVAAALDAQGRRQGFALPWMLEARAQIESKPAESRNVAALLPGTAASGETIVLSAHLDHTGIGRPVNGDAINNGALDNAGGVATTLEVARTFATAQARPRRSILFVALTAEEKGLVGAEYFVHHPAVPLQRIAANVNLDMPVLLYDFTDVIAFGAQRSTIGTAVTRAAAKAGVTVSPDPLPEEGLFTRSDHYEFVKGGVPSVFLMTGFANGGEKQFRAFLAGCYHKPCDDLSQPINYAAGAKFARVNYEIARELADARERPRWNRGDFFGDRFGAAAK